MKFHSVELIQLLHLLHPSTLMYWQGCCRPSKFLVEVSCLFFLWICRNFCVVLNWIDAIFDRSIGYSDPRVRTVFIHGPQFEFQFNIWSAGNWSWLPIQVQFSYLQLNSSESNSIFEVILLKYGIGLKIVGKLVWQQEKGPNEDISIVLIIREQFSVSVLFKDTLETILLILHLQDNVIIQSNFFQYMYHVGCAFNLHSVINNGLIPGGQKTNSVFQH